MIFAERIRTSSSRLCSIWHINHSGLHYRWRGKWIYTGSSIGEFCLATPILKKYRKGNYYSRESGLLSEVWPKKRRYIDHCSDLNLGLRYIGSMVSDIHRIMFHSGIFFVSKHTSIQNSGYCMNALPSPWSLSRPVVHQWIYNLKADFGPFMGSLHERCTLIVW